MSWQEYMMLAIWVGCSFILIGLILGVFFYIFGKTMIKNKDGETVVSTNSWHFRIAYPFRRFDKYNHPASRSFLSYFTKIFFMLFLGWPVLLSWEAAKIILYSPVLFLFGYFPIPDFKEMSEAQNPFCLKITQLYVPTTASGFNILPIYIILPSLYGWLLYQWFFLVLIITSAFVLVLLIVFLLNFANEKEIFTNIGNHLGQSKIGRFIERTHRLTEKFNYKLGFRSKS